MRFQPPPEPLAIPESDAAPHNLLRHRNHGVEYINLGQVVLVQEDPSEAKIGYVVAEVQIEEQTGGVEI